MVRRIGAIKYKLGDRIAVMPPSAIELPFYPPGHCQYNCKI
ncbi:hypothetical protein QUA41_19800 [Microcoleus sp. Pol11C1]